MHWTTVKAFAVAGVLFASVGSALGGDLVSPPQGAAEDSRLNTKAIDIRLDPKTGAPVFPTEPTREAFLPSPDDTCWVGGWSLPGLDGSVQASVVYQGSLVVGGQFSIAGGAEANNIARWDGSTWSTLGSGMNDGVASLCVKGDSLFAGGDFTTAGGVSANRVACWDGSAWSAVGTGMDGRVRALCVYHDEVVAAGEFSIPGSRIARWTGSSWVSLGSGMNEEVQALAVYGDSLIAGGDFTAAGGIIANRIAAWDGSSWWPLGAGMNSDVTALSVYRDSLIVVGSFSAAGLVSALGVAGWDGHQWSAFGDGVDGYVEAVAVYEGALVVSGSYIGYDVTGFLLWDGADWSFVDLGGQNQWGGSVYTLCQFGSYLYIGGSFMAGYDAVGDNLVRWDGARCTAVGAGINGPVFAVAVHDDGVVIGGEFTQVDGIEVNHIAYWDGAAWHPFYHGLDGDVITLLSKDENLYAGGFFQSAEIAGGDVDVKGLARWDGYEWGAVGSGLQDQSGSSPVVHVLAAMNDDLIVGGTFLYAGTATVHNIARWDGVTWSSIGNGVGGPVYALASSDDTVFVGGSYSYIYAHDGQGSMYVGNIAGWDGTGWFELGEGLDETILAMARYGDMLVVGGYFDFSGSIPVGGIAQWDGSSWSSLGSGVSFWEYEYNNGFVSSLTVFDDQLAVGGWFDDAGGVATSNIATWNGSSWEAMGSGLENWTWSGTSVEALCVKNDTLVAGGYFVTAGGKPSVYLAEYACAGSGGCCLPPTVGDVNQSGDVDITDVQVMIDHEFLTLAPLVCDEEGDVDFSGEVDITDLSVLIDNQFLTLTPLLPCP